MNINNIIKNTLCLIYILSASGQTLFASQPEFNIRDNGIDISIKSIEINIAKSPFGRNKETINFEGLQRYSAVSLDKEKPQYLLRFVIAVPDIEKASIAEFSFTETATADSRIVQFYNTDARPSAIIRPAGVRRGIQMVAVEVNPAGYDPESQQYFVAGNVKLRINFNQSIPSISYPLGKYELTLFADVINKEHLNYLHSRKIRSPKDNSSSILEGHEWYSPDFKYIKIATSKDAVTKIDFSKILSAAPELNGKQSQYLHLIFQGEEIPFAILNDNGIIDANDEAIFWGQVAKGDTTWFNTYTSHAVYYLYFDETATGKRLGKLPAFANNDSEIKSVRIGRHIEIDKIYDHGLDPSNTETTPMEGFYWQKLVPGKAGKLKPPNTFNYDFFADPAGGTNNELEVAVHLNLQNTTSYAPEYLMDFQVNRVFQDSMRFQGETYFSVKSDFKESDIFSGQNNLVINSYKIDETVISVAGVDYVTMKGEVRPSAFGGATDFFIDNQTDDSYVEVYGFSDEIYAVDLINNYYSVPELNSGTTVRAGCSSLDNKLSTKLSTIMINDSSFTFAGAGIHFAVLSGGSYSDYQSKSFTNYSDAENFLDGLQTGDIIIAANNLDDQIPEPLRNIFRGYGSKIADLLQPGEAFVFAAEIGNKDVIFEGRSKSANANISGFIQHNGGRSFSCKLDIGKDKPYNFVINDLSTIPTADVSSLKSSDLRNPDNQADAIYISYKDFIDAAQILADYRSKTLGLKVMVVDAENIYKEFYHGIESPHAIKAFLRYAFDNWKQPSPVYLAIFGDASWDGRKVMDVSISDTYVPAYGVPVSDYWFGLLDDDIYSLPELKVGRITAKTKQQAMNYVNKAIEYDQLPVRPWMKRFNFLTGGSSDAQREDFFNFNYDYSDHITNKYFCGDTISVRKLDDAASGETEAGDIRAIINQGALWTNFLGHASSGLFDMDGWRVSRLNNYKRYGVLSTLSCSTSDFGTPEKLSSRNETYILEKDVGFVVTLGPTATSNALVDVIMYLKMLESITQPDLGYRNISDILYFAKDLIFRDRPGHDRDNALLHFTILGDPLLNIRVNNKTDLFINEKEISLTNAEGSEIITEEDSVVIFKGVIYNNGFNIDKSGEILLIHNYSGKLDSAWQYYTDFCHHQDFNFVVDINANVGKHTLTVIVDPLNKIDDPIRENNIFTKSFEVYNNGLQPIDPLPFWNVSINPKFRVVNPKSGDSEFEYEFLITEKKDTLSNLTARSDESEIESNESYVEWSPEISLSSGKSYWLQARLKNTSSGFESSWLQIPFYASDNSTDNRAVWKQTSVDHLSYNKYEHLEIPDSSNPEIHLETKNLKVKIISVNGSFYKIPKDDPDYRQRWVRMEIDDNVYFDDYGFTGFNVVVISRRADSIPVKAKNFNTWRDTSSSTRLVRFLRDSVKDDDYVLIGTSDQSFRVPYHLTPPDSAGYIDTLKAVLREFGSAEAVKLDSSWSFAMIGYRGAAPGSIPEMAVLWDTASVSGDIIQSAMTGKMASTVVGPSKRWESFNIDAKGIDDYSNIREIIKGIDDSTGNIVDLLEADGLSVVDLSGIDAEKYPYLFLELIIERDSLTSEPFYAGGFHFDFQPAPELSIVKSETGIEENGQLRGYDANIQTMIKNISKRSKSQETEVVYEIALDGNVLTDTASLPPIEHDEAYLLKHDIDTKFLSIKNDISIFIDPDRKRNELYTFNNSDNLTLNVKNDSLKPYTILKADGEVVNNLDYVAVRPFIEVEFYDNSPLPIGGLDEIEIRINSKIQDESNTENFTFTPIDDGTRLKAIISFIPDSLDIGSSYIYGNRTTGDNLFKIASVDAGNNRDTLKIYANVSLNGYIRNLSTYPNPFETDINIKFEYIAPDKNGLFKIYMYNTTGRLVRTLSSKPHVGKNELVWDGRDSFGRSLPMGFYRYLIYLEGGNYVESVSGACVLAR